MLSAICDIAVTTGQKNFRPSLNKCVTVSEARVLHNSKGTFLMVGSEGPLIENKNSD